MHYPRRSTALTAVLALAFALPSADAADLIGADAVLQRLVAQSESPAPTVTDSIALLKTQLSDYRRDAATLAPADAAARWLALFDAFVRVPSEARYAQPYSDRVDLGTVIEALPPPAAWDALASAIQTRTEKTSAPRELGLRILGAVLAADPAAQTAAVEKLRAAIKADKKLEDYELQSLLDGVEEIDTAISESAGDSARLAAFERELAKLEKPARRGYRSGYLGVPDLVRYAGRAAAEPLLLRALRLDVELQLWRAGDHTRRALAELALQNVDSLKRPQWELVSSLDDVALYEALAKKFPGSPTGDSDRRDATFVYLFGLVASGRTEEATALVFAPEARFGQSGFSLGYGSDNILVKLQRSGRGDAVVDFLRAILARDPALPFWETYIAAAAQQSRSTEVLALLREVLARPDLAPDVAASLRAREVHALLAADQIDGGIAALHILLAADRAALASAPAADASAAAETGIPEVNLLPALAELAAAGMGVAPEVIAAMKQSGADTAEDSELDAREQTQLRRDRIYTALTLGRLLEKPELTEEGLAIARLMIPTLGERDSYTRSSLVESLAETLEKLGRADEAEAALIDELLLLQRTERGSHRSQTQETLVRLAALYSRAGRHADVLRLFTGSPDLGVPDLGSLPIYTYKSAAPTAHLLIADALIATGRAAEARPILRRIVQNEPGCDAAYERLEKLGGPDYAAFLDRAARLDRFEERPLIWKARLQLASGDLAAAEQTVRAAIAIDPSDGEQGKGDRMRAYAVLGDILEKRGDADQAALMRGAVAAIRLSEDADDWWAAGLLTRAVRLYEKSLLKFADAYCIQSRLALRYNELGDAAKAEEHYRRAFELMPESFGRVESHCFGCEGAFNGPRAQNVAENVFTRLAAEPNARPQVYYLLGYLRTSQDRPDEAAENFRKAVALDPDYLNAWEKLQGLAGAVHLPAAERETIALALLRLDPEGKRTSPEFDGVSDLRKLWAAILAIEAARPERETGPLFAFPAAQAKIEADRKNSDEFDHGGFNWSERRSNPRERLSDMEIFSSTAQLIESTLNR